MRFRKDKKVNKVQLQVFSLPHIYKYMRLDKAMKYEKGVRWMPRLLQAMKDVISCDKLR